MGQSMPLDIVDKEKSSGMTRGQLARVTGCNIETIRYFEKIGLLPDPGRSAAGYRIYSAANLRQLTFIQHAKSLGFSTENIHSLLQISDTDNQFTRADAKALTETHIAEISQKIIDLKKIKQRLTDISSHCDGSDKSADSCPIMASLFDD